jgi:glutamate carboxypeptidase
MIEQPLVEKISSFIDAQTPAMFAMLETVVSMESGSYDVEDVNALGEYMAKEFTSLGCAIRRYPAQNAGFPLLGTLLPQKANADARRILLLGHRDTVFPSGTIRARPFTRDDVHCYGPCVADMKGGIVAGFFAMKTLLALKETVGSLPVEMLLTSDEEIGSGASTPAIIDRCGTAGVCFCLEPARANGNVVTGRDGAGLFTIDVYGKSSHAGISFSEGISAINGLASVIVGISSLSDDERDMTVNVGLIKGGSGGFIVPDYASATVSLRFATLELRDRLVRQIQEIIAGHNRGGLRVQMSEPLCYLPLRASDDNNALFDMVREAGTAFAVTIGGVTTRGSADSGLTSSHGVPTICGMGPVGGNLHTDEEYLVSATLPERTKVLALTMIAAEKRFISGG